MFHNFKQRGIRKVNRYKYLGSWITEDARCEKELKARIGMAKAAFWQNKEVMRRNVRFGTKKKIIDCYVFSVLNYGCESWTWNEAMFKKINAFEMWCYRRMLKISWKDRITNVEVLQRMHTSLHFMSNMKKRETGICRTCYEGFYWRDASVYSGR